MTCLITKGVSEMEIWQIYLYTAFRHSSNVIMGHVNWMTKKLASKFIGPGSNQKLAQASKELFHLTF